MIARIDFSSCFAPTVGPLRTMDVPCQPEQMEAKTVLNPNERSTTLFPIPFVPGLLVTVIVMAIGCAPPAEPESNEPSYADLVTILNQELTALDRLENKRTELLKQIAMVGRGTDEAALEAVNSLFAATQEGAGDNVELPADPNELLDQVVENEEAREQTIEGLLDAAAKLTSSSDGELSAEDQAKREELMADLGEIEKEIIAQKQRVERARQARDAAKAKQ